MTPTSLRWAGADAALANRVDLGSTGGYVIGFVNRKMLDGVQGPVSLVSWSTHKLRRVAQVKPCCTTPTSCRMRSWPVSSSSSIARITWSWSGSIQPLEYHQANTWSAGCGRYRALYDTLKQQDVPNLSAKEKHTALEVLDLSQHLVEQGTILRWCSSDQEFAHGMTKILAQDRLKQFLKSNQRWNLLYDGTFTAVKKLKTAKTADDLRV